MERGIDEVKKGIAGYLLAQIRAQSTAKQLEILSSISEDELIAHMTDQLSDEQSDHHGQLKFEIPIDYQDEDGNHYGSITLSITDSGEQKGQLLEQEGGQQGPVEPDDKDTVSARQVAEADEFGFPERDAWEGSVYELGDRPMRCDVMLGFGYTDSEGAASQRQIRASAFVPWLDDDHLVMGFCNHRKANRSFVTSRMTDVTDLRTGECLDDVDQYLITEYEASDYKKVDDFIDEKIEVVECLMYLARLDGNVTGGQREIINDYVVSVIQSPIVTERIGAKLIKEYAEDIAPNQFRKLVGEMKKNSPECLRDLQQLGPQVVEARKGSKDGGVAALKIIQ